MKKRLLFIQYCGFTAIGLGSGVLGPLLPAVAADLGINYSQAGIFLAAQFFGSLIAELSGGPLADRFGKKLFLLAGGLLILAGAAGCALAADYPLLLVWNALLGAGLAIYNVGINALCADSTAGGKGRAMNFLHFFFGAGSILAPLLAAFCLQVFGSWRAGFGLLTVLPFLVLLALLNVKTAPGERAATAPESSPYRDGFLWSAGLFTFFYVGLEVSMGGWITAFWSQLAPRGPFSPQWMATLFWAALTAGRLICGRVVDRVGFSAYIIAASCGTLLLSLCWYLWPVGWVTALATAGIGLTLAGIFPTMMAALTGCFPGSTGKVAALITVCADLGGFLIVPVVGRFADWLGFAVFPAVILGLAAALTLIAYPVWGVIRKYRLESMEI
ncbi:fucose permease [Hydrogenispora ethanolica]|uniref:Fucose permease n=1 Tax=Hydrogenispora ethanolica TaxID=1082276 RepID=A0A4R1S288_HYDET|nr:MFS transporter [Hydrogenispora ethanolica]TCL73295.1 fucose permease [Hydrogenispora ethanolica]